MRDMMGRVGGLLGSGYQNFMNNMGGGAGMTTADPALQAQMRRDALFNLGAALSSGGNAGEALLKAREAQAKTFEAIRAERDRKARIAAMQGAMGPNGPDRNKYIQALIDAGIAPDPKELGDWASLAKTDAETGKARAEGQIKSFGLAAQLAQGGAPFHAQVADALAAAGVGEDQVPALLDDPQKLIAIGMTPEEAQKLQLERARLEETRRANMAGEATARGNLGVAQGNLGLRKREVDLREGGVGGYAAPMIPMGAPWAKDWGN